jgi:hypothetical protein
VKYLLSLFVILFVFRAQAQEEVTPAYHSAITCFDVKAGIVSYHYLAKNYNQAHASVSHGSTTYPQKTEDHKGYSPYIGINGASRFNPYFELLYGLSYMFYANNVYSNSISTSGIPGSVYYNRTVNSSASTLQNHVFRFSFAPVFRFYNTKLEIGVVNLDYVHLSQRVLYGQSDKYQVIPKHNSYLDSVVITAGKSDYNPELKLVDKLNLSFSLGLEQEIPIQKYRYLVGFKGVYSRSVLMGLVYVGIRFSKPYRNH